MNFDVDYIRKQFPSLAVEVDGKPAELLRANYILRAVALEEGEHEVVFRYDMSLLRKSAYISATTFGVISLILLTKFFRPSSSSN